MRLEAYIRQRALSLGVDLSEDDAACLAKRVQSDCPSHLAVILDRTLIGAKLDDWIIEAGRRGGTNQPE